LGGLAAAPLLAAAGPSFSTPSGSQPVRSGTETVEAWRPGNLDIHHIATGCGNAALVICPDGTSLMIDAGAIYDRDRFAIAPKPDASRRAGEWIARYAARHLKAAQRAEIDYFLLTHLHRDHMGEMQETLPRSAWGDYRLTGIADVAETLPVRRIIDRGFPDYRYPAPLDDPHQRNYIAFVRAQQARGAIAEKIKVGSAAQIRLLRDPDAFAGFKIRNLVANGEIWTGQGEATKRLFPDVTGRPSQDLPTENECCLAIRLDYGAFSYYCGGDLSHNDRYGAAPWADIESPVAKIAGPVDVAVANHHAYADATGADFVRALRPRAFVVMTWDSAHPAISPLGNMLSRDLYPDERSILITAVKPENEIVNRRLAEVRSRNGHILVRVAPGGGDYRIFILDNGDESDRVIDQLGPFPGRGLTALTAPGR
jgi:beta-lactamase superfamily II metal-dependent hydrolase